MNENQTLFSSFRMKTQSKTQEIKKSLLKTINTEKGNESMESEDEMSLDSDEEVFLLV